MAAVSRAFWQSSVKATENERRQFPCLVALGIKGRVINPLAFWERPKPSGGGKVDQAKVVQCAWGRLMHHAGAVVRGLPEFGLAPMLKQHLNELTGELGIEAAAPRKQNRIVTTATRSVMRHLRAKRTTRELRVTIAVAFEEAIATLGVATYIG